MKFNKIANFFKNRTVYLTTIALLVVILIIYFKGGTSKIPTIGLITVNKGQVSETVSVTGNIKSSSLVDLGFEKSGRVSKIYSKVGDRVKSGDYIVALSNDDLYATLRAEEAKLASLTRGTRPEQLAINQSQVDGALTSLSNAEDSLFSALRQVYVSADDSIRNKVDELFNDPRSSNPLYKFRINTTKSKLDINYNRLLVEENLVKLNKSLLDLSTDVDPSPYVSQASQTLLLIKDFLTDLSLLVNDLDTNDGITQTNIDKYKNDVSTARATISSAINTLSSKNDSWLSASSAFAVEKNKLNLALSGSTNEDIQAEQAVVDGARAALQKTIITAPFDGILTRQDAILGQIVNANQRIATVLDDKNFLIEANIPEVDIGYVNIGNPVSITIDAFPDRTFLGKVSYIEPSETIVDGVVNFKIKVSLDNSDSSIKTGLTANLDIETQRKTGVMVLPQNALLDTDKGVFVNKVVNGKTVETNVKIGIRGADGFVEIISGVSIGDKVVDVSLKK